MSFTAFDPHAEFTHTPTATPPTSALSASRTASALTNFQTRLASALTHTDQHVADHLTHIHRFIADQHHIDADLHHSLGGR